MSIVATGAPDINGLLQDSRQFPSETAGILTLGEIGQEVIAQEDIAQEDIAQEVIGQGEIGQEDTEQHEDALGRFLSRTSKNQYVGDLIVHGDLLGQGTIADLSLQEIARHSRTLGDESSVCEAITDAGFDLLGCATSVMVVPYSRGEGFRPIGVRCCNTPACEHTINRRAVQMGKRGDLLNQRLQSGMLWKDVKEEISKNGCVATKFPGEPSGNARMGWRLLSLRIPSTGNFAEDLLLVHQLRSKLAKLLRKHGAVAMLIGIHIGENGGIHLHVVAYSPFIEHGVVRAWHRMACSRFSLTDMEDEPEPEDRPRDVHIMALSHAGGASNYVAKYNSVAIGNQEQAERRIAASIILEKKKIVESYGLAKPGCWSDRLEPARAKSRSGEGQRPRPVAYGYRDEGGYVWHEFSNENDITNSHTEPGA